MRQIGLSKWLLALLLIVIAINPVFSQWGNWVAPDSANDLKNPFADDESASVEGKQLFDAICFVCHGNQGKGDGINAANLERPPANLTSDLVQRQSDGVLFWKISEGNPPMLSFKSSLSEEQRWKIVDYIRELAVLFPDKQAEHEVVKEESKKSLNEDLEKVTDEENMEEDNSLVKVDNNIHEDKIVSIDEKTEDTSALNNSDGGVYVVKNKNATGDYSLQYMLITIFAGILTVVLILFSMIYIVLKY
jgi:mono/diheme cytochrome c family protein